MTTREELAARLTELAAEIADALEGVTPGEWRCWNGFKVTDSATMAMTRIGPDTGGGVMADRHGGNRADLYASREDAEFVAAAPELMAQALDSLREAAVLLAAPERPEDTVGTGVSGVRSETPCVYAEAAPERPALDRETLTNSLAKAAPFTLHDRESADALAAILLRSFAGSGIRLAAGKEDRG